MLRRSAALGLLSLLLISSALVAQQTSPAESAGKTFVKEIAPFLSPEVMLVARVQIDKLTAENRLSEVQQWGAEKLNFGDFPLGDLLAERPIVDGVSEMTFLIQASNEYDAAPETFALLRMNGKISADKLVASVLGEDEADEELMELFSIQKGNWLAVTASEELTERLNEQLPFAPAKLAKAADLLADDPIQLIGMMTGDTIYSMSEELPSNSVLLYYSSKMQFAIAGVQWAPEPQLRLALQFRNEEDAAEAHDWLEALTTPGNLSNPLASLIAAAFKSYVPKQSGDRLALMLEQNDLQQIGQLLAPAIAQTQQAAQQAHSIVNMKQIGLAFHNFADTYKRFPPAQFPKDQDGKPLLSWRVYLLPYLEQNALFDQFHLDEPWDSEHNLKLAKFMPEVYQAPGVNLKDPTLTTYVVPQGKNAFSTGDGKSLGFQDFTDGTSNTIMAVRTTPEAAVVWTKPDDWQFDPQKPFQGLAVDDKGAFMALFADGSVRWLTTAIGAEDMKNYIERNDGNYIEEMEPPF
ncbi:DUF1559 domain-containing protein [Blastopirellula sp. JC732]|uniref:DUF1559 domain-containing protein n=1 Tax=Blastopirellula sediminis TaxID=2894196 RepID=A0A9X1MR80_9BACT|nr:DUF1559 domain-containing protein [Blastopirellula sediminis]MCC9605785.1 DUF1559 domain-containing protein [Blastopirellula sediminis]MCC9630915.1 DUF1559 domain-containing protein [Blastopirellula sediminis]